MSELSTEEFSFEVRQEQLVTICLYILFHGMLSSLIVFLVYFHWNSRKTKQQSSNILMGLVLLLYTFRVVNVATDWWCLWRAFIVNGDTSNHIILSLSAPYPSLEYWMSTIPLLLDSFELAIVDGIMIWRCWIICNRIWSTVIMQMILTLASFATGLSSFGLSVSPAFVSPKIVNAMLITNIASSVASTVLSTLIIVIRILQVSRIPGAPRSRRLNGIIEIIVESAAIYAIAGLVYLPFIFNSRSDDRVIQIAYIDLFFENTVVLAPALIMLRVALGRARPDTTQSNGAISDLQFHSAPRVAARSRGTIFSTSISQQDAESNYLQRLSPRIQISQRPSIIPMTYRGHSYFPSSC